MSKKKKWANRAKKVSKRFVNPDWTNKDLLIKVGSGIKKTFWSIFSIKSVVNPETFAEAKIRLKLTEEQISSQKDSCLRLTYVFLLMAISMFGYSIYNFLEDNKVVSFATLGLTFALLGFCFKFHFWYFQLKNRHLGYSLQEWWEQGVLGHKPKNNLPSKR